MSLQKKTALPSSVKLEMTREQLELMVYMLGAIDLRTEPKTLEVAIDLRKKLHSAQEFLGKPQNRPTDKYGKHLTDDEIEKVRDVAEQFTTPQAEESTDTDSEEIPSAASPANPQ